MKSALALPELPLLVTVAVPALALPGTLVMSVNWPLALAVADPSAVVVPASVKALAILSPTEKNRPEILNGAVA